jgi:hypothetical protein
MITFRIQEFIEILVCSISLGSVLTILYYRNIYKRAKLITEYIDTNLIQFISLDEFLQAHNIKR